MEKAFVKETIENILGRFPVNARFLGEKDMQNGEMLKFAITTEEPHALIGENGKTLLALNHLVKKIFERESIKKNFKPLNFIVDVNDYQEKRINELRDKARIMAERARFFRSNIELEPMNPYERMLIHSFFSDTPDIKTESTGYGPERRVVIKFVELAV